MSDIGRYYYWRRLLSTEGPSGVTAGSAVQSRTEAARRTPSSVMTPPPFYAALPGGDPGAADRNAKTNGDRAYWLGEITPRGVGLMLEAIESRTIASKAACDDMLRMMRAQQAGARRLNHFISVPVAHKTGDFPPVLANDVGIIYARSGPIAVSFLGNAITGNYGEAEDRIGRFAQQLVEYFDK